MVDLVERLAADLLHPGVGLYPQFDAEFEQVEKAAEYAALAEESEQAG